MINFSLKFCFTEKMSRHLWTNHLFTKHVSTHVLNIRVDTRRGFEKELILYIFILLWLDVSLDLKVERCSPLKHPPTSFSQWECFAAPLPNLVTTIGWKCEGMRLIARFPPFPVTLLYCIHNRKNILKIIYSLDSRELWDSSQYRE